MSPNKIALFLRRNPHFGATDLAPTMVAISTRGRFSKSASVASILIANGVCRTRSSTLADFRFLMAPRGADASRMNEWGLSSRVNMRRYRVLSPSHCTRYMRSCDHLPLLYSAYGCSRRYSARDLGPTLARHCVRQLLNYPLHRIISRSRDCSRIQGGEPRYRIHRLV